MWSALGLSVALSLAGLLGRTIAGSPDSFRGRSGSPAHVVGTLQPSHQRPWADDVAQLLEAGIDGSHVHLKNVRNFQWRSETDYTPAVGEPHIRPGSSAQCRPGAFLLDGAAHRHTLVSFGFDGGGERVVFSLEIRKERHESFSAIGGFFRQFEQILVAADERDIVRTRSNARGEDVYLYRLQMNQANVRALFLEYLHAANELRRNRALQHVDQ